MHFHKKKWAIILFLIITNVTNAQKNLKNITISINPLAFIDTEAGIAVGAGFDIGKQTSIFTEFGVLMYDPYHDNNEIKNSLIGYKIKPSFRYNFKKQKNDGITKGGYIAGEFLFKSVKFYKYDPIGINDSFGNFAYTYIGGYTIRKNVIGFSVIFGNKFFIDKKNKLGLDIYTGIGLRNRFLVVRDLPEYPAAFNNTFFERKKLNIGATIASENPIPSFSLGFRVTYRIK